MANYTAIVYPQTAQGGSYARPALPSTITGQSPALTSPNWNPYSSNASDRTEWWEDSAGSLSWDQVRLAAYGLTGVQQNAASRLKAACDAEIAKGYTSDALGSPHSYPAAHATDQINMISSAQVAKLTGTPWAASTAVHVGKVVQTSSGTWLVCTVAGTTGTTEPTGAGTDGGATWADLFPFSCADSSGTWDMRMHTPDQIVQAGMDGYGAIAAARLKLADLTKQVMGVTATGVAGVQAVDAIVWS